MNTTFVINGGAGRVIAAIPALEKFARLNPENDFKVLIYGWESLYWNHPVLQKRTFGAVGKGTFEMFIKDNELIVPEPYLQNLLLLLVIIKEDILQMLNLFMVNADLISTMEQITLITEEISI